MGNKDRTMRMWLVSAESLCRRHLLGEHVEIHMFLGAMQKGVSMVGYVANNLLEPLALYHRHQDLAVEMRKRGYHHESPLDEDFVNKIIDSLPMSIKMATVDRASARKDLHDRCPDCRRRFS